MMTVMILKPDVEITLYASMNLGDAAAGLTRILSWFERVSMMVILLNCVTLGMYQPCTDEVCNTKRCQILQNFDDVIFAFFAIEMVIKMVAMGVWGKGAYLAETWNRLDFFIVMAGSIEYCLDMENMNLSAIRTIRVLRPLRAINRIPSMRILVMLLLDTLPMLGNVLLLCFFVFFIFGIVGVQLWAGLLRQRCFIELPKNVSYPGYLPPVYYERVRVVKPLSSYYKVFEADRDYICSLPKDTGMHVCENLPSYRYNSLICNASAAPFSNNTPTNSTCVDWHQYYTDCRAGDQNPFQGAISFDNIGLAWVAIFLVISLEGWTDIMYYVQDAHSFWDWIYFVLLIVIGSFFMINLCLVVIATQFSETKKREMERMRMERARYQSTSTLTSNSMSEPTSCYTEIIKYIAHLWRRARRKLTSYYKRFRQEEEQPPRSISLRRKRRKRPSRRRPAAPPSPKTSCGSSPPSLLPPPAPPSTPWETPVVPSPLLAPRASPEVSDIDPVASPRRPLSGAGADPGPPSLAPPSPHHLRVPTPSGRRKSAQFTCQELLALSGTQGAALAASLAVGFHLDSSATKGDKHFSAPQLLFYPFSEHDALPTAAPTDGEWTDSEIGSDVYESEEEEEKAEEPVWKCIKKFQGIIHSIVEHRYFQRGILLAILVNTLSMGIEYHNQPEELTAVVETSNVVFCAIFAFEMLLKIIGDGPFDYISNGFNVFDGVIVILSVVELLQASEGSGLSVLRTFRLLRILKLVRFMPALRRQLFVMIRTMDNVAVFFALLILFIFIFSILGMNLFGCKFCRKNDDSTLSCDRKNFDSLLWAIVTVFQILTQEDWNVVLFNGMERTSHWAALYFVALMTFGNYVLFNLLVAILVEGFSAERTEREHLEEMAAIKRRRVAVEEHRKRSDENLSNSDDKNKQVQEEQDEQERINAKLRQLEADSDDPKCNIARETMLLQLPPSIAVVKANPDTLCFPPLITHTAATPQGSPNATLEPLARDLGHKLSALHASHASIDSIDKSSSSAVSIPNLVQGSGLKVPWNNGQSSPRRGSLTITANGAKAQRKDSLSPSPKLQRKGSHSSSCSSPRLHRRGSRHWKRRSRKRGERESLVDSDTDSMMDGDVDDEMTLNNALNNHTACPTSDHSHCNGGVPNNRRTILTQQNSIGSPSALSPQNSVRSHASAGQLWNAPPTPPTAIRNPVNNNHNNNSSSNNSNHPTNGANGGPSSPHLNTSYPSRQNSISHASIKLQIGEGPGSRHCSLAGSYRDDFKPNNLVLELPMVKTETLTANGEKEEDRTKICWFFEPCECLMRRGDYSLYIFGPENTFRQFCMYLMEQKWFDYTTLVFIGLNCITLAMERPNIPPFSTERLFLITTNYIFTVVFTVEMVIKVVGSGLWYGRHTYFRSGWNVMDGTLVFVSLVDVIMNFLSTTSSRIFGILRVFRLLRSLRPLRVINRAPGLKLVVQTLLSSLRPIGNIVLICCTFFIIFGILGVQLFKGTFYYCDGPDVSNVKNRTECEIDTRNSWNNRKYNFDDLGQALMALFVLSSKDGWVNIMYQGLDAVGVDQQPIENYSEWRLLYFISFLLLVGFFVLNMFVGVVVENFHRCREEQEKEEKARRAEKRARKLEKKRRKMRDPPYYISYSRPRLFIHNTVTSKYFDLAIAAVIGLNVVTMAMEFYMMPAELVYALKIFNYFFTAVFILEAGMKVVALGFKRYLKDRWNQLDIVIVILSVVGIVLEEMESEVIPINPTIIRVMRVLRIARVLKLLKMAKGIRSLLDTVMQALPQVGNLGLLFFLLFFIFAALGVELFGRLECDDEFPCQGLGEHAHFANFGMAFLTLFRVATGDNWNGIMKDTLRDNCDHSADCVRNCCVSPIIAPLYFVVFVLMAQFVLVNVVVAVLMKHLEESHKHMDDDVDMDAELEQELAAEEEEFAAALQEASKAEAKKAEVARVANLHKPVVKMSSLPANFTFNLCNGSANSDDHTEPGSPPASPALVGLDIAENCGFQDTYKLPTINIRVLPAENNNNNNNNNHHNGGNNGANVNLRQSSPEKPLDKVAVADLSHISPSVLSGLSNILHERYSQEGLDLSPDTTNTEGSFLAPPPYPSGSSGVDSDEPPSPTWPSHLVANSDPFPSTENLPTEEESWGRLPPSPCSPRPGAGSSTPIPCVRQEGKEEEEGGVSTASPSSSQGLLVGQDDSLALRSQVTWSSLSSDSTSGLLDSPLKDESCDSTPRASTSAHLPPGSSGEVEEEEEEVIIVDPQCHTILLLDSSEVHASLPSQPHQTTC